MVDGRYNDLDHGVKLNEQTQLGGTTSQFDQKSYMNLIWTLPMQRGKLYGI